MRLHRSYLLALGALCAVAPLSASPTRADAWLFLGARNLASGSEQETLNVTSERGFRQLQLCVFNTPLQLNTVSVRFDDGQQQEVPVHNRIAHGACSQAIDLVNAPRHVRQVELGYGSVSRFRRAPMVRIVGR